MHPQEFKLTYSVEIFDHLCTVKSSMEHWMANCSFVKTEKLKLGQGEKKFSSNNRRERAVLKTMSTYSPWYFFHQRVSTLCFWNEYVLKIY